MTTTNSGGELPLHDAARRGDAAEIARLLATGADPGARDLRGRTALLVAAREGETEAARLLLEAGAVADERGEAMNITPLMAATRSGSADLVRLLLAAGADANAAGRNGAGALARAAVSGDDIEAARLLLDAGADPDGPEPAAPPNTAPLWAAVALKRRGLVRLLLDRGAQVNTGDSTSGTPFGVAVTGGDEPIARMLLEAGADPLRIALSNLPLLAVALKFSNPPMARLLEEFGLSLSQSDAAASAPVRDSPAPP